jgi:hypothetical protein
MIPTWLYLATLFCAGWFCCRCQTPFDPPPCGICTADSDALSITIAGLSNATCSGCAFFNATFILPRTAGNACKWQKTGIGGNCNTLGQPYIMSVLAGTLSPSSNVGFHAGVQVSSYYSGTMNIEYTNRRWNSGSTADFDCTATRVTSAYTYLQDTGCNGWSTATITINP